MAVQGEEDAVLILKHVGGLTSGQAMLLRRGVYQFGPSKNEDAGLDVGDPAVVSFELEVRAADDVVLSPGRDAVSIEGRSVAQPVPVAPGSVVQVGPDLFVLSAADSTQTGQARRVLAPTSPILIPKVQPPAPAQYSVLLWVAVALVVAGIALAFVLDQIFWLALVGLGVVLGLTTWFLRRRAHSRAQKAKDHSIIQAKGQLDSALMDRRIKTAQEHRSAASDPADTLSTFSGQATTGSLDGVAIAAGTRPWKPPIGSMRGAGWDPEGIIDGHSTLPAVPYGIDLNVPFGVCGPRPASLAVTRYVVLAIAERIGAQNIAIDTNQPQDWEWTHDLVGTDPRIAHFVVRDRAGATPPARGLIITEELHPLPPGLSGVLSVGTNGLARLHDSSGNPVANDLVPYGITGKSALSAAVTGSLARTATPMPSKPTAPDADRGPVDPPPAPGRQVLAPPDIDLTVIDLTDPDPGKENEPAMMSAATRPPQPPAPNLMKASPAPPTPPAGRSTTTTDPSERNTGSTTLFTARHLSEGNELLASVAIDLCRRMHPNQLSIVILDSGSRPLIRLRQLSHCIAYAGVDNPGAVDGILDLVDRQPSSGDQIPMVFFAVSDLVSTVALLRSSGRSAQADRILQSLQRANRTELMVAGSSQNAIDAPDELHQVITSFVERNLDGSAEIHDVQGDRPLNVDRPSGRDLTGAVARLTRSAPEAG